jgi:hypothetical protein
MYMLPKIASIAGIMSSSLQTNVLPQSFSLDKFLRSLAGPVNTSLRRGVPQIAKLIKATQQRFAFSIE